MCTECGDEKRELIGTSTTPEGYRTIETHIDSKGGYVRMSVVEYPTGRVVYQALYAPEVARTMAQMLTLNSIKIEDESG